jgi:hypothetical protein
MTSEDRAAPQDALLAAVNDLAPIEFDDDPPVDAVLRADVVALIARLVPAPVVGLLPDDYDDD